MAAPSGGSDPAAAPPFLDAGGVGEDPDRLTAPLPAYGAAGSPAAQPGRPAAPAFENGDPGGPTPTGEDAAAASAAWREYDRAQEARRAAELRRAIFGDSSIGASDGWPVGATPQLLPPPPQPPSPGGGWQSAALPAGEAAGDERFAKPALLPDEVTRSGQPTADELERQSRWVGEGLRRQADRIPNTGLIGPLHNVAAQGAKQAELLLKGMADTKRAAEAASDESLGLGERALAAAAAGAGAVGFYGEAVAAPFISAVGGVTRTAGDEANRRAVDPRRWSTNVGLPAIDEETFLLGGLVAAPEQFLGSLAAPEVVLDHLMSRGIGALAKAAPDVIVALARYHGIDPSVLAHRVATLAAKTGDAIGEGVASLAGSLRDDVARTLRRWIPGGAVPSDPAPDMGELVGELEAQLRSILSKESAQPPPGLVNPPRLRAPEDAGIAVSDEMNFLLNPYNHITEASEKAAYEQATDIPETAFGSPALPHSVVDPAGIADGTLLRRLAGRGYAGPLAAAIASAVDDVYRLLVVREKLAIPPPSRVDLVANGRIGGINHDAGQNGRIGVNPWLADFASRHEVAAGSPEAFRARHAALATVIQILHEVLHQTGRTDDDPQFAADVGAIFTRNRPQFFDLARKLALSYQQLADNQEWVDDIDEIRIVYREWFNGRLDAMYPGGAHPRPHDPASLDFSGIGSPAPPVRRGPSGGGGAGAVREDGDGPNVG